MRILHITNYTWENGGPTQVVHQMCDQQSKLGHQISILSIKSDNRKFYLVPAGVELIKTKSSFFSRFIPEFSIESYMYLKQNSHQYDLIHIHCLWNFGSIMVHLLNLYTKSIITIHGSASAFSLQSGKLKKVIYSTLFQKTFLKKISLIHVLSDKERSQVEDYVNIGPLNNIITLPNGVDFETFQNLPNTALLKEKHKLSTDKIVLFLSRLDKVKGLDILLPAMLNVIKKIPETVLILAGPDYGMLPYITTFIKENKLESNILCTGIVTGDTKLAYLNLAKVFVLPSYADSFSVAVIEALSCGIPVVASPETGLSDKITEYEAGIICKYDSNEYAEAIIKFLTDEKLTKSTSNNAKKLVLENYVSSKIIKELLLHLNV